MREILWGDGKSKFSISIIIRYCCVSFNCLLTIFNAMLVFLWHLMERCPRIKWVALMTIHDRILK